MRGGVDLVRREVCGGRCEEGGVWREGVDLLFTGEEDVSSYWRLQPALYLSCHVISESLYPGGSLRSKVNINNRSTPSPSIPSPPNLGGDVLIKHTSSGCSTLLIRHHVEFLDSCEVLDAPRQLGVLGAELSEQLLPYGLLFHQEFIGVL